MAGLEDLKRSEGWDLLRDKPAQRVGEVIEMTSDNYTYWKACKDLYLVVDKNENCIAQCHDEDAAALIVEALNGVGG